MDIDAFQCLRFTDNDVLLAAVSTCPVPDVANLLLQPTPAPAFEYCLPLPA